MAKDTMMEHGADEAGGEAIYSSDGLSPLTVPHRPPLFTSSATSAKKEEDVLEEEGLLDPSAVLSKFGGPASWMTSRQRLACLETELQQLELQLQNDPEGEEDVLQLWSDLSARVSALTVRSTTTTSTTTTASTNQPPSQEKDWKSRLDRLESILLGQSSSSKEGKSILDRLEHVEALVKKVDEKSLEQASARAKVIRADLEAAAKAKAKLSSSTGISGEEGKQIQELYSQLRDLEGMSTHLPMLAHRLEQCSSLHVQAAQFTSRLSDMETSIHNATLLLNNLSQSLTNLESNLSNNLETLQQNMSQLNN